ncbi:MAG: hypothetical protein GY847_26130 [Proteobacteria bacterium]|nr:hypothetical protein [Pseudomonadota bacterium]
MGLADRYINTTSLKVSKPFQCQHYNPLSDNNKHCKHYIKGGACSRPDELMCVEWIRVNDNKPSTADIPEPEKKETNGSATDLLGHPLPKPTPPSKPSRTPPARKRTSAPKAPDSQTGTHPRIQENTQAEAPTAPCGLADKDIESFKELGVEVCIDSEVGRIWLVPEYTDQDRMEITPEHMALICYARMSFPESRIISLEKKAVHQTGGEP